MKKRSCSEGHFLTVSMIFASNILVISSVILFHTVCNKIKKRRFTRWEAACFSLFWYLMSLHLFHDDYNLQFSTKATKMRNINQTSFSLFRFFVRLTHITIILEMGQLSFPFTCSILSRTTSILNIKYEYFRAFMKEFEG